MAKVTISKSVVNNTDTSYQVKFTLTYKPEGSGYYNHYSSGSEAATWSITANGGTSSGKKTFDSSPSSQTLGTRTVTYAKSTSSQSKSYSGKFVTETGLGTLKTSGSVTVPALALRTVTFNGNGETDGSTASKNVSHGRTFIFPTCEYLKTGYSFIGWGTSASSTSSLIQPGETSSAVTANLTYYAIWELDTFQVKYNANGGISAPDTQLKYPDEILTLASSAERIGHTLIGWNTDPLGAGTSYALGGTYTENAGVTLYAQWTANTITVRYNKNNDEATGTMPVSTALYGSTVQLSQNLFQSSDYLFKGWSLTDTGQVSYQDGASLVMTLKTSGTVDFYAVWEYRYLAPDIQGVVAYRTNASHVQDDAGNRASVETYVIPGRSQANDGMLTFITTEIVVEYRESGTDNYIAVASPPSITARGTVTQYITANLALDKTYDIRVTALAKVGGVEKERGQRTTIITLAEFIIDIDGTGHNIGIFGTAPDGTAGENTINVNGNLTFEIDDTTVSGTDFNLKSLITSLGWGDDI